MNYVRYLNIVSIFLLGGHFLMSLQLKNLVDNNFLLCFLALFLTSLLLVNMYFYLDKKYMMEEKMKADLIPFAFIYITIITFSIIEVIKPWERPRFTMYLYPMFFLSIIIVIDKIVSLRKIKWFILLLSVVYIFYNLKYKEVLYLSYDEHLKKENITFIDEFLKEKNNETPTIVILEDDWRRQVDGKHYFFKKNSKDWHLSKIMPMLYNKKKLYMIEEENINRKKFEKIVKQFGNPEEIYVISRYDASFLDSNYVCTEVRKIRYKFLMHLKRKQ